MRQANDALEDGIQVSGLDRFSPQDLKGAIMRFLRGLWKDDFSVTYRPKINFGGCELRLDLGSGSYRARLDPDLPVCAAPRRDPRSTIEAGPARDTVERALFTFAQSPAKTHLIVRLQDGGNFQIWKRPGGYGVTVEASMAALTPVSV